MIRAGGTALGAWAAVSAVQWGASTPRLPE